MNWIKQEARSVALPYPFLSLSVWHDGWSSSCSDGPWGGLENGNYMLGRVRCDGSLDFSYARSHSICLGLGLCALKWKPYMLGYYSGVFHICSHTWFQLRHETRLGSYRILDLKSLSEKWKTMGSNRRPCGLTFLKGPDTLTLLFLPLEIMVNNSLAGLL